MGWGFSCYLRTLVRGPSSSRSARKAPAAQEGSKGAGRLVSRGLQRVLPRPRPASAVWDGGERAFNAHEESPETLTGRLPKTRKRVKSSGGSPPKLGKRHRGQETGPLEEIADR